MKNVMTGQAAAQTAAAQTLSAYRRAIMDMLVGCPFITTAEYNTAMQRTLACQDVATLQKWYRNAVREIARREELEPETAPIEYATAAQKEEIIKLANSPFVLRAEKVKALLSLPRYSYSEARALIGELWAKILHRQERDAEGHEGASDSYSLAA